MDLDENYLHDRLRVVPGFGKHSTVRVAYSGGGDSTLLLHLTNQLRQTVGFRLTALHVDHGIAYESGEWASHCQSFCDSRGIDFRSTCLDLGNSDKRVSEAEARSHRYVWFEEQMDRDDILLTAHHQDDQVVTFLLNLMRGAGVRGLAGIQAIREFGGGWLLRPLLDFSKSYIVWHANDWELEYLSDPANFDPAYDRNYMEHDVLPAFSQRWAGAADQISLAIDHFTESRQLIDALARTDLEVCQTEGCGYLSIGSQLDATELKRLDKARQINLIRYWTRQSVQSEPGRRALDEFIYKALQCDKDFFELCWSNHCIYLYQNMLYLTQSARRAALQNSVEWDLKSPLELRNAELKLVPKTVTGTGLSMEKLTGSVSVRFRTGSERITLPGREHSSSLKKLFQQDLIPPWERSRLPMIYCQNELAAVVPWIVSDRFKAEPEEPGIVISLYLKDTDLVDNLK